MPIAAIDLFCGIGGLTNGLQRSGIDVVAGFDIEESCRYAYETNNHAQFINKDVTTLTANDINALYPEGCTKILVGCAPCQPFSTYTKRYRKEGQRDTKWNLLLSFARIINDTLPSIVSMENVPQLVKEDVFEDFVNTLKSLNYYVYWNIVFAPDYGIPQNRRRLVLLASRFGPIRIIDPIYSKENYPTVRSAISNLPHIEAGEHDQYDALHVASRLSKLNKLRIQASVPDGSWRDWDSRLKLPCHKKNSGKSYPSVYGRMNWDSPSPTITTQFYGYGNGRFGHPEQDRALSLREGAILQSFPPNYAFVAPNNRINKRTLGVHIGNAVPVELGHAIGESIQKHLKEVALNE